jgi:phosphoglycerol transferase MdoB-like AlkP superfamily enzyme
MATRTSRAHGATAEGAEGASAEPGGLPSPDEGERLSELASRGSAVSAAVLVIATLMPWVSITFFSASTLSGVRVWEGRIAMILAVLAGAAALAALYWRELSRRTLLLAAAVCGALAFLATLIFGFRFRDAIAIPAVLDAQALGLANAGAGLDAGWYLAMASSLVLVAVSVWGFLNTRETRPAEAVPGMEWVEPDAGGAARTMGGGSGSHASDQG